MGVDLLDTEGDAPPRRTSRAVLVAALVVAVAGAVAVDRAREDGSADAPSLRLSVGGFATSGGAASVDYTVTNDGRRPVRLVDVAVEDDAARVIAVRVPPGEIAAGQSVGATVDVRFSCATAVTRPVRPGLRLTAVTPDGRRHVVAPAPGSDLALGAGGGSLLTGPATAPCSGCLDVLDALAPVDAQTHAADRAAAARAQRGGGRVLPGIVEQAQATLRAVRRELPADQRPIAATALEMLDDIAADSAPPDAFELLDQVRDDLDEVCDPAVPEALR